jgi:hypothetical protein
MTCKKEATCIQKGPSASDFYAHDGKHDELRPTREKGLPYSPVRLVTVNFPTKAAIKYTIRQDTGEASRTALMALTLFLLVLHQPAGCSRSMCDAGGKGKLSRQGKARRGGGPARTARIIVVSPWFRAKAGGFCRFPLPCVAGRPGGLET